MSGQLVPFQNPIIYVSTAAALYATNVFEGIRVYEDDEQQEAYAFRPQEHFARWFESMEMIRVPVPTPRLIWRRLYGRS